MNNGESNVENINLHKRIKTTFVLVTYLELV